VALAILIHIIAKCSHLGLANLFAVLRRTVVYFLEEHFRGFGAVQFCKGFDMNFYIAFAFV
jgi:hypothetical protein